MKYLIILGDGMADRPISSLQGKTPLMVANKPYIDKIATMGKSGKFKTIPDDMPTGSAVANLEVLGFDFHKYYEGRGVLEAANMGIELDDDELAMRLNLIALDGDRIKSHSAGHITNDEATILIEVLRTQFKNKMWEVYQGLSYKHLLKIKGGCKKMACFPPHDYPGVPIGEILPKSVDQEAKETETLLRDLIFNSQKILANHPINQKRKAAGKLAANCVWPWSPGNKPVMPSFKELYGLQGAVISAVDLINGIGVYAGMQIVKVDGATGYHDTNYEGKAQAAINALRENDFIYLHIEASDEAGHDGDLDLKIKTIEYLDSRVVKHILTAIERQGLDVTVAILPDHATPVELRTHTRESIPFTIWHPGGQRDQVKSYDEQSAEKGCLGTIAGNEFMKLLLHSKLAK